MFSCVGYAAEAPTTPLKRFTFDRREPGPTDIRIDILYCGVCHSDLHTARDEWGGTVYPVVPGHEIVGRVSALGAEVTGYKIGDIAGVGCMVGSCQHCPQCADGLEQYCDNGTIFTYNSPDAHTGGVTYGGYSKAIVVDQSFVLRITHSEDLAGVAPLLCAGITTYSPLRHWKVGPGQKVGVVGLGGLGHMGVKFAHALGAHVVLFTTSPGKTEDAMRLGADEVVISRDADAMAGHANSFDFIIDCVGSDHDINAYVVLLKRDATLVQVGAPPKPLGVGAFGLIFKRRSFAGSLIEMIGIEQIDDAYDRMLRSDVKYRFVIDMASL
jgi:uncharacterized zinc-type alcohol dehydrogenase-like protein